MGGSALAFLEATVEDAPQIAELLNAVILARDGTALTMPVSVEEERRYLDATLPRGWVLLALRGTDLLGFQSVQLFSGMLGEVGTYMAAQSRGQGIGRQLTERTAETMRNRQVSCLLAEIADANARGRRAYQSWGFRPARPGTVAALKSQPSEGKTYLELCLKG
ncbi:GNAT family N-acetyltransferase [Deinococcus sp. SDU3-2]|uniref:GNAT family N-acetyltransferase n=1 Tax=Deinococcus terrestris TaxID=2651870 RepID=A0A7X1TS05_9DEIO|nr:GNAT family N-acetyltransferase [Deinococcus terrestris]